MESHHSARRSSVLLTAVLLFVCAADLFPQGAPAPQPMPSMLERTSHLKAEFELLDANGDGRISGAEYRETSAKAMERAERAAHAKKYEVSMVSQLYTHNRSTRRKFPEFSLIDADGDGVVTFHKEFLTFSSRMFSDYSRWDLDDDGEVTRREHVESIQTEQKERTTIYGDSVTPAARERLECEFALRDRNKDGHVTWAELLALEKLTPHVLVEGTFADHYFVTLDADYDGVVSRDEFLAHARNSENESLLELERQVFPLRDLDGNGNLSFEEFAATGENPARGFLGQDKDEDGVIAFNEAQGIPWIAGKSNDRDRCYFRRLDADQDGRVTWREYRSVNPRTYAFGAIDHLDIDNSLSKREWDAVEGEYRAGQRGESIPAQGASSYALQWFPWIFDLVKFEDLDRDGDEKISWREFRNFPN